MHGLSLMYHFPGFQRITFFLCIIFVILLGYGVLIIVSLLQPFSSMIFFFFTYKNEEEKKEKEKNRRGRSCYGRLLLFIPFIEWVITISLGIFLNRTGGRDNSSLRNFLTLSRRFPPIQHRVQPIIVSSFSGSAFR